MTASDVYEWDGVRVIHRPSGTRFQRARNDWILITSGQPSVFNVPYDIGEVFRAVRTILQKQEVRLIPITSGAQRGS